LLYKAVSIGYFLSLFYTSPMFLRRY